MCALKCDAISVLRESRLRVGESPLLQHVSFPQLFGSLNPTLMKFKRILRFLFHVANGVEVGCCVLMKILFYFQ